MAYVARIHRRQMINMSDTRDRHFVFSHMTVGLSSETAGQHNIEYTTAKHPSSPSSTSDAKLQKDSAQSGNYVPTETNTCRRDCSVPKDAPRKSQHCCPPSRVQDVFMISCQDYQSNASCPTNNRVSQKVMAMPVADWVTGFA